ncbi:exodeoxyribonuclease VII large subunit [Marinomonas piezotolerans]|uniref:Exodeoxyribonuclease 7 large subunit n=1 Tax=Marinomonas piezotolerans TaxID=2213058 RepID=A0A370U4Z0_9GAMM|nr:exodeoxyribonuclease VII large subunit [Marinomonas piezotolerans]RDL42833.1 exodeoxyribonuclease VII large subunit [Marinomonas piezotolerans]
MKKFTTLHSSEPTFSVSELNRQIQQLLEASLPWIMVEGEISNIAKPGSGHWYFSLKDDRAQIRCAMFKGKNVAVRFKPKDGDLVRLRARVTFYGARGDCQLVVEGMEAAGEGALQAAYERLKHQLQMEGLFDPAHKKPLPTRPERVAIITSAQGAAVRDMVIAFRRRFPLTELTVLPTLVQGHGAASNIQRQLERADSSGHFDAIIVGRGGGSLEDLWSFNDESLARAIFQAKTPIVSAVGHEVDFTICDFVADVRAATPTAAAELLSPDVRDLQQKIAHFEQLFTRRFEQTLQQHQQRLDFLVRRIRHPKERIEQQQQRLAQAQKGLQKALANHLEQRKVRQSHALQRLIAATPQKAIVAHQDRIAALEQRLGQALTNTLARKQDRFASLAEKLHLVSPLNTLSRGYAIARHGEQVIRSKDDVAKGDAIEIKVQDGTIDCLVNATHAGG